MAAHFKDVSSTLDIYFNWYDIFILQMGESDANKNISRVQWTYYLYTDQLALILQPCWLVYWYDFDNLYSLSVHGKII